MAQDDSVVWGAGNAVQILSTGSETTLSIRLTLEAQNRKHNFTVVRLHIIISEQEYKTLTDSGFVE